MHNLIQLRGTKGKVPVSLAHSEQSDLRIISGGESLLHHRHQLLIALAQESEKNRLFVLKVSVDSGLATLNALGHFTGCDSLPPLLSSNLACGSENALPHLLPHLPPFLLSALLNPHRCWQPFHRSMSLSSITSIICD